MVGTPDGALPAPALWARALATTPSRKFTATSAVYHYTGLARQAALAKLVQANIEFTYRYYLRLTQLLSAGSSAHLRASVDPSGSERLFRAASRGRGVLLVSAHLGDFDVVGSWLALTMGLEVVVVSDSVPERLREQFFQRVREGAGLLLRRSDDTTLMDVEADLRAGRLVLWMLDRRPAGPAVVGQLLGRTAWLPAAVPILARRTQCPVVAAVTITAPHDVRSLHVGNEIHVGDTGASFQRVLRELAQTVGAGIRKAPWQWHVPVDRNQLCFTSGAKQTRDPPRTHLGALRAA
ncbi:MAG TPA: hypothetical protein VN618_15825 [Solirubrobacteraceae bacterium]|nr:hypothetical protein [Solirubrobacteraceae bacterium]